MEIIWENETKKIEKIKWKNQEMDVVIKKLSGGDDAEITDASTEIKMLGKLEKKEFHFGVSKLVTVLKGIVDAPFKHGTIEDIKKIPSEITEKLYDEIRKFNNLDENEKKSDSSAPSENPSSNQ
jgi:hypothetical protein